MTLSAGAGSPEPASPRDSAVPSGQIRPIEVDGAPGVASPALKLATLRDLSYAAPRLTSAELHSLGPLAAAERSRLDATLTSGDLVAVGIARPFAAPAGFDLSQQKTLPEPGERLGGGLLERNADRFVWTAGFESRGAGAVRLRLEQVSLPAGTVAYVYNRSGEVHGPLELGGTHADPVWTNTVFSSTLYLELQFPRGSVDLSSARLSVAAVAHLENPRFAPSAIPAAQGEALPDCFRDVRCASGEAPATLDDASRSVAMILFERDSTSYVCSGALVNTTAGSVIPYFLTANHCVNSAASAKSAELFWDYRNATCAGPSPNQSGLPRTLGTTLVATGVVGAGEPDFTLLRLSQAPPSGRFYLGWSSAPLDAAGGVELLRIAHPDGGPQMFSKHVVSAVPTPGECPGLVPGTFIYSKNEVGATRGGSSGAPAFLADGLKIVGQLYGRCGNNLSDACDAEQNSAVDGAFASSFGTLQRWLAPPDVEPCTPGTANLCLLDSRFRVTLVARDVRTGERAAGYALAENDLFGYFSLPAFTGQSGNPEVFVKMLDGRKLSGRFWVFYGGLTDFEFTMTVTDTATGVVKTYTKQAGSYCGDADTQAF
ncbi:MAG: trypsin-like peptidase domain-containing protein [Thermoanaerobaculia bacterium]